MYKSDVWFELGNYSGEVVFLYVPKVADDTFWVTNNIQADRPIFDERYQRREFGFELTPSFPWDDGACDLLLVFLAVDPVESHALKGNLIARVPKLACNTSGVDNRRGSMFVPVPEAVQAVEQYYVIPTLVRLYGRYPVSDRIR